MTGPRSILLPDEDGHYSREAMRLDRPCGPFGQAEACPTMRWAHALSGQLSAFSRHEIVAACKEYGGTVIQMTGARSILLPDEDGHHSRDAMRLDGESLRHAAHLDKLKHVPRGIQ